MTSMEIPVSTDGRLRTNPEKKKRASFVRVRVRRATDKPPKVVPIKKFACTEEGCTK